jgi:hypothetical protein
MTDHAAEIDPQVYHLTTGYPYPLSTEEDALKNVENAIRAYLAAVEAYGRRDR